MELRGRERETMFLYVREDTPYLRILFEHNFLKVRGSMYTVQEEYIWTWNGQKKDTYIWSYYFFSSKKNLAIKWCPERRLSEDYI